MEKPWILVLAAVLAVAALGVAAKSLWGRVEPASSDDVTSVAVAKARADIKQFGWHFLMVRSEDGHTPSFLYTVGLWETYKHPEILLFAPMADPAQMAGTLTALVKRVAAGETLKAGEVYGKVFGKHSGAIRDVHPRWFPSFLGTAGAVYGSFDFPAVQVYWPDQEGRFPWTGGFKPTLFPLQPILFQDNVVLANVGYAEVQNLLHEGEPQALEASLGELFVKLEGDAKRDLLADWRWRVGPEAELLHVTIFGDLFLKTPDGHIHWLDTGSDDYHQDIAPDREGWLRILCDRPALFLHASTLLHFRSLKYFPKEGQVYSWILPPLLGGEDNADNFDIVDAFVHVTFRGRSAEAEATGGQLPLLPDNSVIVYTVVTNDEKEYSIWPADREIPAGWRSAGKTGTRQECMDFISEVWVDLRPESLRKKRADEAKDNQQR